jgi:predicted dehydrogenase
MPEKVPVGIVGGGSVGEEFIRQINQERDTRVTGIVTATPARQRELREKHGVPAFSTVQEMMGAGDKPFVVCVVNANDGHRQATITALQAGAHVYCEKPMAPTLSECVQMVQAEQRSGRHLQIGFEYMHGTMTRRLMELIGDGFFGRLTWAQVIDSRGHWASADPSTDVATIMKLNRRRGGGIILHCGIHQLDMIRCYLGPIAEMTAYRPPRNALEFYPPDVPDVVTLMIKAESGAVCNFQVSHSRAPCFYRAVPPFHPDWRTVPGHQFDVSIIGTGGSCHMQIYEEKLHLFRIDQPNRDILFERTEHFGPNHPSLSHHDMHGLLMKFIRSVASGGGAIDPAAGALETMRLAFAAEDAIAKGTTVRLSEYK